MATRESDFWNERAGPRIAPEHMGEILTTAADIALVLGAGGGILSVAVNPLNAGMGRLEHWAGRHVREVLAPDSLAKVERAIAAVQDGGRAQAIEVNHVDGAAWTAPIRYTAHPTGRDGRVLFLGRDLRPLAELQQRLVRAQQALERDHEMQRVHETRFRALLAEVTDAVVLLDMGSGKVLEANAAAGALLGASVADLPGTTLAACVAGRRKAELADALAEAGGGENRGTVEVATRGGATLRLHPRVFRSGGERVALVRMVATETAPAEAVAPRDARMAALFDAAADGLAFTDAGGLVIDCNDAFLSLLDLDHVGDVRGRALSDFLARGAVDMRVLTEKGGARLYATQVVSAFGTRVPVEVTPVDLGPAGHAFLLREAERTNAVRDGGAVVAPDDVATRNARAQVGTAPLRDIVASMTDVVEKECIEAAVELTSNNRVAAAEMLGLSRQSLYVKLRKYGLLRRGE